MWWSEGKHDDIFWRTDSSGGRAKFRKRYQKKDTYGQAGDVQAVNPIGQPLLDLFTIELKRGYSKNTIVDMLDKREHMSVQIWEKHVKQAMQDARNAKSISWMLIHRRDQRDALVDFPLGIARELEYLTSSKIWKVPHMECYLESKEEKKIKVYSAKLSTFLEVIEPEHIIQYSISFQPGTSSK